MNKRGKQQHNELLAKILEQRSKIDKVQDSVSTLQDDFQSHSKIMKEVKEQIDDTSKNMENLKTKTQSMAMTVVSMRDVGIQLLHL